jgi:hypothetical protein
MSGELQWAGIADFSPGIHQIVAPSRPPGAAQAEGTYRCRSADGGALVPLPRRKESLAGLASKTGHSAAQIITPEFRIVGLHAAGPVYNAYSPYQSYGPEQSNTELFVAVEYWREGGDLDRQHLRVLRMNHNTVFPQWRSIWSTSKQAEPYNPKAVPVYADFVTTRSNNADADQSGPTVTVACVYGNVFMYPDDSNPSGNTTRKLPGDISFTKGLLSCVNIVGHQGRIVGFPLSVTWHGEKNWWIGNEQFWWTKVNDLRTLADQLSGKLYWVNAGFEDPSGYQAMASLTADELFLVKSKGGGLVLRGSLNNFTAVNYPYIRSAGYSLNKGTTTPIGFAYPVDASGLWVWAGGEASEHVSKQLESDFWRPPVQAPAGDPEPAEFLHYPTQCANWGEWAALPNNWLWDTDYGGFWRIEDPADVVLHRWSVDWRSRRAFASPSGVRTDDDVAVYSYDKSDLASNYRWHGHPQSATMDREVELREVVVVASGIGEVRVRAYSATDQVGQTKTFVVNGTPSRPTIQRQGYAVNGAMLTFELDVSADSPLEPAPTVHEIRYGVRSTHRLPRTP